MIMIKIHAFIETVDEIICDSCEKEFGVKGKPKSSYFTCQRCGTITVTGEIEVVSGSMRVWLQYKFITQDLLTNFAKDAGVMRRFIISLIK